MSAFLLTFYLINFQLRPVWKHFMALASARPDCLFPSSGADYRAWSGASQNWNVFVRSAASQPLIRVWLTTNLGQIRQ